MAGPYITDDQLLSALAGALYKTDPSTLAIDATTLHSANVFAYQQIVGAMLNRGFAQAQVDSWDQAVEYSTHLALYWCFTYGGVPFVGESHDKDKFDRRKELKDTPLFIGGVMQFPGSVDQSLPGAAVAYGTVGSSYCPPRY